ncbi:MAG TPA: hypothetical protein PLG43_03060 [Spirochaetia bacterium]|nr:hypothetical protein [Spirochaetia bacterium]
MRNFFCALCICICSAMPIFAELPASVIIRNDTGYQLDELYMAVEGSEEWGDNLLGRMPLRNGEQVAVNLPEEIEDSSIVDLLAVDDEGDDYLKSGIDLASESNIILFTFDDFAGSQSDGYGDDYDTAYAEDYDNGYDDGYMDGYRDAFKEAFKEGYSKGFSDGLQSSGNQRDQSR